MGDIVRTTLLLPAELQIRLREAASRLGRTQTELVREALDKYLQDFSPPAPKSIGIATDSGLSSEASERWLAREWGKKRRR
jgi:hypothetical protein